VASDLGAFARVLGDGECGVLFPVGDAAALADALVRLLGAGDDASSTVAGEARAALVERASRAVRRYDWGRVAQEVLEVYETVRLGADRVGEDPRSRTLISRWLE